jgi:hypothetical protein
MAYLLDSSVFITAKRVHYGFDFCPGFWDWLREQHHAGKVYSIHRVYDELKDQEDDLADWVRGLPDSFFISPDPATVSRFSAVSNWARNQNYHSPAITTFLPTADYYLVAQALQGGHTVVTYEVPRGSPKRIKIPDACLGVGVDCILPHELLRREQARFVLKPVK